MNLPWCCSEIRNTLSFFVNQIKSSLPSGITLIKKSSKKKNETYTPSTLLDYTNLHQFKSNFAWHSQLLSTFTETEHRENENSETRKLRHIALPSLIKITFITWPWRFQCVISQQNLPTSSYCTKDIFNNLHEWLSNWHSTIHYLIKTR